MTKFIIFFVDHDILLHFGSIYGYRSFITLFPGQNIGVFISMNGEDDNYILRILLHNFLSDVALGVTPWLDAAAIWSRLTAQNTQGNTTKKIQKGLRPKICDCTLVLYMVT